MSKMSTLVFGNYYEILGISRSATDFDIKKAYKKLARKWHPDKNRSPEANDRFTKINEAYEALSNPEKRKEYDAFGSISNEPRDSVRNQGNFWSGSNFGNAYFEFGQNDHSETQFESTNYRHYKIDILPNSHTQPTLILLVSHFCLSCHHAMRLWGNIASTIIESGIRVTIADVMADSHLREELRIHHVPSVIMVIDGQVRYLQSEINKETVIDFIRYSFPKELVQTIQSEHELNYFHDSWFRDSRSKMIMTKPLDRPSFRYLSIAFKYRDKISAGYIHLEDNNKRLSKISGAYNLRTNEETVIIFHDEKHYYPNNVMLPKPVGKKSQSRLTLADIDTLVQSNCVLPFPRLLSQKIFDLACPPPSQKQRSFGFCVITVVHSKHAGNLSQSDSWQYVRSSIGDRGNGKIMYLFGDVQYQFLHSLQLEDPSKTGSIDSFMDQVILLWRQSYTSATSLFLANPWQYSNIEMVLHNWDLLSNFDKALSILKTKNQIQTKVTDSDTLSELVDELAAPLWRKICSRLYSYGYQVYAFLYDIFTEPFNLVLAIMGLSLASYAYSTAKAVSAHLSFEDIDKDDKLQNPMTNNSLPGSIVPEFTRESYLSLFKEGQSGRWICVILATENTSPEVLLLLQDSITKLKCNRRLLAMSLRLDRHITWIKTLLGSIENDDDHNVALSSISSLSVNRPFAYEGIVLALNIGRCSLSICPINLMHRGRGRRDNDGHRMIESRVGGRLNDSVAPGFFDRLSFDLESSSSDEDSDGRGHRASVTGGPFIDIESQFFDWLSQLMEGCCKRYRVSHWPPAL